MLSNVTTFTSSDFSRAFLTNGDASDHAWEGPHLILGGDIYGHQPTAGMDINGFSNPSMTNAAFIPIGRSVRRRTREMVWCVVFGSQH
ncbi:hypothetical protein [Asticcacaulis sp.]|uniref:hypothetical protein n=1 Tax=Asticcacaulis sp. TaxID=1872648 RepID=UPI0039189BCA